ncbi:hypothetical protein LRB11_01540 [Ectothiorhodospira haloalkaliphila]|uniref:hypothetical protein n=1 Tax=Ectothiorhodospira haloalkaliphila TaxID=421628 RepID=UPI001EE8B80B|nr:hypothetical protein [Ectothiorhodospira haloalkaliphila]MCG5523613.1 hypothetical protein [Ectothiorhodospira haloalkaliphila]
MNENIRFPDIALKRDTDSNLAVRAFGRRFYRDQTPLEYLAEFLLCFSAGKSLPCGAKQEGLPPLDSLPRQPMSYWSESRLALKLFAFFASSKLETRHPVHVLRFKQLIADIEEAIETERPEYRHRAVTVLQKLFSGFVGVAGQRTWVTHSFIPASRFLLSREVDWRHSEALKKGVQTWADAQPHFTGGSHNFMARGGEVLFLQLWHALRCMENSELEQWLKDSQYHYIVWNGLANRVDNGLHQLLDAIDSPLVKLGGVVERAAEQEPPIYELGRDQKFGWVPRMSWQEGALFAWELSNIVASRQDALRKVRVLQDLCCLQVLRSMCFQAARLVGECGQPQSLKFVGGYAWIAVAPQAGHGTDLGKVSHASQSATEELLFKAVRSANLPVLSNAAQSDATPEKADEHGFKLFRSLGKQIGLIVPRTGPMRFTLSSTLLEATVLALIPPGERVSFDEYLWRLYRHFGIAVGAAQIEAASSTLDAGVRLVPQQDSAVWLEDELKRGGFLIPLSDANPLIKTPE